MRFSLIGLLSAALVLLPVGVVAQEPQIWVDFEDLVRRSAIAAGKPLEAEAVRRRTVVMRCLVDGLILCYVRDPQQDRGVLRQSLQEAITALCL